LYRYDSESVSENQCCGSELIFFGFGSTKYFFRIRILRLIFWPGIFLNGASHCFYSICVWNLYYREKSLPIENHIFSLSSGGSETFTKFLNLFYNRVWILIRIRTFFVFGSGQNLRILSDSDPQHWWKQYRYSITYEYPKDFRIRIYKFLFRIWIRIYKFLFQIRINKFLFQIRIRIIDRHITGTYFSIYGTKCLWKTCTGTTEKSYALEKPLRCFYLSSVWFAIFQQ
jgi:hypothetical protein